VIRAGDGTRFALERRLADCSKAAWWHGQTGSECAGMQGISASSRDQFGRRSVAHGSCLLPEPRRIEIDGRVGDRSRSCRYFQPWLALPIAPVRTVARGLDRPCAGSARAALDAGSTNPDHRWDDSAESRRRWLVQQTVARAMRVRTANRTIFGLRIERRNGR
jgi:hypothetical protein